MLAGIPLPPPIEDVEIPGVPDEERRARQLLGVRGPESGRPDVPPVERRASSGDSLIRLAAGLAGTPRMERQPQQTEDETPSRREGVDARGVPRDGARPTAGR